MNEKTTIQEIIAQKESEWVDEKLKEIEHLRTEINNIMKNEDKEKAKQIAEVSQILSDFPHDYHSVEYGAMKMAEFKNEQAKLKEEQLIEKAADYTYKVLVGCGWLTSYQCNSFIEEFRKSMEN